MSGVISLDQALTQHVCWGCRTPLGWRQPEPCPSVDQSQMPTSPDVAERYSASRRCRRRRLEQEPDAPSARHRWPAAAGTISPTCASASSRWCPLPRPPGMVNDRSSPPVQRTLPDQSPVVLFRPVPHHRRFPVCGSNARITHEQTAMQARPTFLNCACANLHPRVIPNWAKR